MSSANLKVAEQLFSSTFGGDAPYAVAAPGRVNLIGEHTDYNDGFVMPLALEMTTVIVGRKRADQMVRVISDSVGSGLQEFSTAPGELKPSPRGSWINYVSGVVAQYAKDFPSVAFGLDLAIASNVPLGSGLSSSAALEVATATFIENAYPVTARDDAVKKALRCQAAEHEFVGMKCGIMDQFISALGKQGHALLIDCRSYVSKAVPLVDPSVAVLIINTNAPHELVGSPYNERREACEEVSRRLHAAKPAIKNLRDATVADLDALRLSSTDVLYRRAHHVITEDDRTVAASDALKANDYVTVGRLMYESHSSLSRDYEVSTPELDALVQYAADIGLDGGVYGARMTGGGFGGCIVALVKKSKADAITSTILRRYKDEHSIEGSAYTTQPGAGAHVIRAPADDAWKRVMIVGGLFALAAVTYYLCPAHCKAGKTCVKK